MAFAHLAGAFSLVVNQFGQLSAYAAVVARLSALGEAAAMAPPSGAPGISVSEDGGRLAFDQLTLRTPQDGRVLVRGLSLDVAPGARAVVVAARDTSVALERAIAGMWPSGEGRIVRPGDVMFLPERSYLPPGTLRELLVGTGRKDDELWSALRTAGVDAVVRRVGGLDVERDWDDALSVEEQRLVEIARMLLAAPNFVVLTRLDASVGAAVAAESRAALSARGIGQLVLENQAPAAGEFDETVRIAADGSWTRTGSRVATG
jgi:putative ATP-binding cassette transporter